MTQEVDFYKIYIDRLGDGKVEEIDRYFPADVMQIQEAHLAFEEEIHVVGQAYLSEGSLVLCFNLDTAAAIDCSICNEPVKAPICVKGIYHVVSIDEVKRHVYDMRDIVRESILLHCPKFAECNEGNCGERDSLKKYLKKEKGFNQNPIEGQQPFKDLSLS